MASEIDELINEYKKEEKATSPVWIWFNMVETNSKCKLCKSTITRKDSSTSGMRQKLVNCKNNSKMAKLKTVSVEVCRRLLKAMLIRI